MKCRLSNREVSLIYILSAADAAALCVVITLFSLRHGRHRVRFHNRVPVDLIGYGTFITLYAAARRTSMYSNVTACCCAV